MSFKEQLRGLRHEPLVHFLLGGLFPPPDDRDQP